MIQLPCLCSSDPPPLPARESGDAGGALNEPRKNTWPAAGDEVALAPGPPPTVTAPPPPRHHATATATSIARTATATAAAGIATVQPTTVASWTPTLRGRPPPFDPDATVAVTPPPAYSAKAEADAEAAAAATCDRSDLVDSAAAAVAVPSASAVVVPVKRSEGMDAPVPLRRSSFDSGGHIYLSAAEAAEGMAEVASAAAAAAAATAAVTTSEEFSSVSDSGVGKWNRGGSTSEADVSPASGVSGVSEASREGCAAAGQSEAVGEAVSAVNLRALVANGDATVVVADDYSDTSGVLVAATIAATAAAPAAAVLAMDAEKNAHHMGSDKGKINPAEAGHVDDSNSSGTSPPSVDSATTHGPAIAAGGGSKVVKDTASMKTDAEREGQEERKRPISGRLSFSELQHDVKEEKLYKANEGERACPYRT